MARLRSIFVVVCGRRGIARRAAHRLTIAYKHVILSILVTIVFDFDILSSGDTYLGSQATAQVLILSAGAALMPREILLLYCNSLLV